MRRFINWIADLIDDYLTVYCKILENDITFEDFFDKQRYVKCLMAV